MTLVRDCRANRTECIHQGEQLRPIPIILDKDGYITNAELFHVLKMMVGNNLADDQLQQVVDKTMIYSDKDGDQRISFKEFCDALGPSLRDDIINGLNKVTSDED